LLVIDYCILLEMILSSETARNLWLTESANYRTNQVNNTKTGNSF